MARGDTVTELFHVPVLRTRGIDRENPFQKCRIVRSIIIVVMQSSEPCRGRKGERCAAAVWDFVAPPGRHVTMAVRSFSATVHGDGSSRCASCKRNDTSGRRPGGGPRKVPDGLGVAGHLGGTLWVPEIQGVHGAESQVSSSQCQVLAHSILLCHQDLFRKVLRVCEKMELRERRPKDMSFAGLGQLHGIPAPRQISQLAAAFNLDYMCKTCQDGLDLPGLVSKSWILRASTYPPNR